MRKIVLGFTMAFTLALSSLLTLPSGDVSYANTQEASTIFHQASNIKTERLAGADRFSTAVAISKSTFAAGVPVAYVANGLDFPDALAGAAAAGTMGGPVLLTMPNSIPDTVKNELKRLNPNKIIVLGGKGVVTTNLEKQLKSYTAGKVDRLAGSDRFSTAVAISKNTFAPDVPVAYVASAMDFPDALAGAAAAGVNGSPVLLTSPTSLNSVVKDELKRLKPKKIIILGGTGAVTNKVKEQIEGKTSKPAPSSGDVYYKNCTEVRNAGAAPLLRGQPGYSKHLDRDNDGVACE